MLKNINWEMISSIVVVAVTLYGFYYNYYQKPIWDKIETLIRNNTDITAQISAINTRGAFVLESLETMRLQAENSSKDSRDNYDKLNIKMTTIFEEQRGLEHQIENLKEYIDFLKKTKPTIEA